MACGKLYPTSDVGDEESCTPGSECPACLRAERDLLASRIREWEDRLTAVMPADCKNWHQNSRNEWPEVAALTIQGLREREGEAWAVAERLRAELEEWKQSHAVLLAGLPGLEALCSVDLPEDRNYAENELENARAALAACEAERKRERAWRLRRTVDFLTNSGHKYLSMSKEADLLRYNRFENACRAAIEREREGVMTRVVRSVVE